MKKITEGISLTDSIKKKPNQLKNIQYTYSELEGLVGITGKLLGRVKMGWLDSSTFIYPS